MTEEFEPRPFQLRVAELILSGKNVILQAPTGSGKTATALYPYLFNRLSASQPGWQLPVKCIYAVPMRVLANQFYREYRKLAGTYDKIHATISEDELETAAFQVRIQTGEHAHDPEFKADLIFTTIDQLLSNFLGIPYALSNARANLNCGAVISRYLILDEFHLFPIGENNAKGAFSTALLMLKWIKEFTPFILMTATFSSEMLETLKIWLDAEVVTLDENELAELESEQKERYYHTSDEVLNVETVLDKHQSRSLVVFNTVARAQAFYRQLLNSEQVKNDQIKTCLLHSRFTKNDRQQKENWAMQEFGKDRAARQAESAILVATQVIEVGLDISCENLHTELAEATSLVQRGGRCARYKAEIGHVYIYRPLKEGQLQPHPYRQPIMEAAWQAFSAVSGQQANYKLEMNLVNTVHSATDKALLETLQTNQTSLEATIRKVMIEHNSRTEARNEAADLIRQIYNTSIVIHPDPKNAGIEQPRKLEGFSLYTYNLRNPKRFQALLTRAKEQGLEGSGMWYYIEEIDKTENIKAKPKYIWKEATNLAELAGLPQLFISPALAAYDNELGFRLLVEDFADEPPGSYQVAVPEKTPNSTGKRFGFQKETYQQHISLLLKSYKHFDNNRPVSYRQDVAWIAARMEQKFNWEAGLIDRAIRLACACHDLGKMTEDWQEWAHKWQDKVGAPVLPFEMLAHTLYEPDNSLHQNLEKDRNMPKRPPHAVQGAVAAAQLSKQILGNEAAGRAVVTAIARHHSADANTMEGGFKLHKAATSAMAEVFKELEEQVGGQIPTKLLMTEYPRVKLDLTTQKLIIKSTTRDNAELLLYYLLVRILRQCDVEALTTKI